MELSSDVWVDDSVATLNYDIWEHVIEIGYQTMVFNSDDLKILRQVSRTFDEIVRSKFQQKVYLRIDTSHSCSDCWTEIPTIDFKTIWFKKTETSAYYLMRKHILEKKKYMDDNFQELYFAYCFYYYGSGDYFEVVKQMDTLLEDPIINQFVRTYFDDEGPELLLTLTSEDVGMEDGCGFLHERADLGRTPKLHKYYDIKYDCVRENFVMSMLGWLLAPESFEKYQAEMSFRKQELCSGGKMLGILDFDPVRLQDLKEAVNIFGSKMYPNFKVYKYDNPTEFKYPVDKMKEWMNDEKFEKLAKGRTFEEMIVLAAEEREYCEDVFRISDCFDALRN